MSKLFERYVAIGDSTAEGFGDPDGHGGTRGFNDRLATRIAAHQPGLLYANLAVRGLGACAIREGQLAAALAMRPDLATIMAGMNDLLRPRFDAEAIASDIAAMQRAFLATGCVVISFTVPDVAHRLAPPPFAQLVSRRTRQLSDAIRAASKDTGAWLVDLAAHPLASDPRMWTRDRLHASPEGHARVAAACAEVLALPGADGAWRSEMPGGVQTDHWRDNLAWARDHLVPWLWSKARGRSAADHHTAKRPALAPVDAAPAAPTSSRG